MYLYHVPGKDIPVYNADKTIKDLTEADVLSGLKFKPDTANAGDQYLVFTDLETAENFAKVDQKKHPLEAFPVLLLSAPDSLILEMSRIHSNGKLASEKTRRPVYEAALVDAKDVTIFGASLKHISDKFQDRIIKETLYEQYAANTKPESKKIEKPVEVAEVITPPVAGTTPPAEGVTPPVAGTTPAVDGTTPAVDGTTPAVDGTTPPAAGATPPVAPATTWLDTAKKALPLAVVASFGAAFWASGAVPGVVSLIANALNVAVPAAGAAAIASQVGVAVVAGIAAYATLLAGQTIVTALWHAGKTALANYRKSAKVKNDEEKASLTSAVQALEKDLGPVLGPVADPLVAKFAELVQDAPDNVYAENGELAKPEEQPKVLTQLQVLHKERKTLEDIKAANDETKRKEIIDNVTKPGFKFSMS